MTEVETISDDIDDGVDQEIYACFNLEKPVSFFLFAGAGSGKTRSLVTTLNRVKEEKGRRLRLRGQRVGVITYTNAACDEIKQRLDFDPLIEVSTIHSFAWSLIEGYHDDIREWLRSRLRDEIAELDGLLLKGKPGTKTAAEREKSRSSKQRRLSSLDEIKKFTYSPIGDNRTRDSLNHAEVIAMTADFLSGKPALSLILANRFPILLIDESQDTNKQLMEALLAVQGRFDTRFCLGLFGDVMQRIYADGVVKLPDRIPPTWAQPSKRMNHRSPARIVELINKIRSSVDRHQQRARTDKPGGTVRFFVLNSGTSDKFAAEAFIAKRMGALTADPRAVQR
jgi:ATP-dependent DNA helicase UvrD/PcrA